MGSSEKNRRTSSLSFYFEKLTPILPGHFAEPNLAFGGGAMAQTQRHAMVPLPKFFLNLRQKKGKQASGSEIIILLFFLELVIP